MGRYNGAVTMDYEQYGSSLVEMKLQDPVKKKAEAILRTLVEQYNKEAIVDKSQIAKNTDEFINDRIL